MSDILDRIQVGARIRITKPIGYSDERFADWQEITWLPPRDTWDDRNRIAVGFPDDAGQLRLDWPLDRIEIEVAA